MRTLATALVVCTLAMLSGGCYYHRGYDRYGYDRYHHHRYYHADRWHDDRRYW
jgi:hypothetical protein